MFVKGKILSKNKFVKHYN